MPISASYAPSHCRTSQYCRAFIPFSVSLWNDLADPVFDGVGLGCFKTIANSFLLACTTHSIFGLPFSLSLLSFCKFVLQDSCLLTDRV